MQISAYLLADARSALQSRRLLSALRSLQGLAAHLRAAEENEKLEQLMASYNFMLKCLRQGMPDPERSTMYSKFLLRAAEISFQLERKSLLKQEDSYYATSFRVLRQLKGEQFTLVDALNDNESLQNLFDAVWLSGMWSQSVEAAVFNYMERDESPLERRCLVLSAVTLSLMQFFDIAKYRLLLDQALSPDVHLRARALCGLVFAHIARPMVPEHYREEQSRLRLMSDVPQFLRELELVQAQLYLSLETRDIEKRLQREIIPEMMKRFDRLRLERSLGLDELGDKLSEADFNPEWDDEGRPSKLFEKMNEFAKLHQRGADTYMGQFKLLKKQFSFFNAAANWFRLFSIDAPEVPQALRRERTLQTLLENSDMCNSDRFSFSFAIGRMFEHKPMHGAGDDNLNMLQNACEAITSHDSEDPDHAFKSELRMYVQDFYRFSNLFAHKKEFVNPFRQDVDLLTYTPFDTMLGNTGFRQRMADILFSDKAYAMARPLLSYVAQHANDATSRQKLAFCCEQAGDLEEAITHYQLANDLKPDSEWTLRRLAHCCRRTNKPEAALSAYGELARICPDDTKITLRQAECLILLERYDEALPLLYKVNYLLPDDLSAKRALAWCSLCTKKLDLAEKYYTTILETEPTPTDHLNAGHCAWVADNVPLAIKRYRKALPKENAEQFLQADSALLERLGRSVIEQMIMTDAVLSSEK